MSRSLKTPPPIVFILLSLLVWFGVKNYSKFFSSEQSIPEIVNSNSVTASSSSVSNRLSWGDKLLVDNANDLKQQGIEAYNRQDYRQAADYWRKSLAQFTNDPETVIYLNNARIANSKSYSIVVSAPIGVDVNTAQEILRGVAQAQNEINARGGINGVPLRVAIADDDNEPETAKKASTIFCQKSRYFRCCRSFFQ